MASKKVVRIHFMDDTVKAFAVDESTTSEQLKDVIVERIELKEHTCFAIFEQKDGWERCLEPEEKPCDLMTVWSLDPKKEKKETSVRDTTTNCFIFKKKIFLRDDEREMQDPVAKHLVYIQALFSVIESEYPCSVDDAIRLGGLQVQQVYGDHKPGNHTTGFLTNNLRQFVPKELFLTKKIDWEASIFKAHAQNVGKTEDEAKTEYLEIVKQWPYYGTTFYPPCKSVSNRRLPARVIVGVNAEGILLLKNKEKELVSTHPFTEICSWASSSTTFSFEFGSQTESQKYTFDTKQGAIIASTIQTYIDILVQILKNGEEEEEEDDE